MKKLLLVAVALFAGVAYFSGQHATPTNASVAGHNLAADRSTARIAKAFANQESRVQLVGNGIVVKVLPDDTSGSRHQRFILELASGQTLLVAHNIDIAQRISALRDGDRVEFSGEYEWNAKGGVIHWTHRDARGAHVDGYLKHDGRLYH